MTVVAAACPVTLTFATVVVACPGADTVRAYVLLASPLKYANPHEEVGTVAAYPPVVRTTFAFGIVSPAVVVTTTGRVLVVGVPKMRAVVVAVPGIS